MSLRSTLLWVAAGIFVVVNLAGAGYAVAMGEPRHAAVHAVLLVVGIAAYLSWRSPGRAVPKEASSLQEGDQRIDYLQQSIDAVALEVERIGEAQRFSDKLRAERGEKPPQKKLPEE